MHPQRFQAIVDRYYEPLYRFGYSLSGNRADAGDLVQQTFFIWARHGDSLRDPAKAKSWLFTTLYREFLKLHRHAARHAPIDESPLEVLAGDDTDEWIARLDVPALVAALRGLDDLFRVPICLFYLEELSYKGIAEVLGVPIGTVMSRLARGKQQLRQALRRPQPEPASAPARVIPWPQRGPRSNHG